MDTAKNATGLEPWLAAAVAQLPGAGAVWKPEWEAWTFVIGGKLFAMQGEDKAGKEILSVKGDPEDNVALRQAHAWIVPGYYLNKKHWNSLRLGDPGFKQELAAELFANSYQLVFAALPKKTQAALLAG